MRAGFYPSPEALSTAPPVTAEATADLMKSLRSIVSPLKVVAMCSILHQQR
jgi:hypothetical protein